jgi:hypothetical protein
MYNEDDEEVTEIEPTTEPPAEMPKGAITITINMDQYLSSGTLEDLIAKNIERAVSGPIQKVIEKRVEATILEAAKGQFTAHAEKMTAEFFEKEFFKTNQWGSKTGEKTNALEMFAQMFREYLGIKVDDKGNETGYDKNTTRAAFLLRQLAIEPLNAAIKEQVGKVAAEAKTQITNSVSRYIADQLTPQIPAVPQLPTGK